MILNEEKMEMLLKLRNWTPHKFADALNISIIDAYKLLGGEFVKIFLARIFIKYFKANIAQKYIDWDAMEMVNPYKNFKTTNINQKTLKNYEYKEEKNYYVSQNTSNNQFYAAQ